MINMLEKKETLIMHTSFAQLTLSCNSGASDKPMKDTSLQMINPNSRGVARIPRMGVLKLVQKHGRITRQKIVKGAFPAEVLSGPHAYVRSAPPREIWGLLPQKILKF